VKPAGFFRNTKQEYLKDEINALAMNRKNVNSSLVKDENDYRLADSDSIVNGWKNTSLSY
jgi:hypothetical protein